MRYISFVRTALSIILIAAAVNILLADEVAARQEEIADSVLRFHIRANSDSEKDQELKLMVKEAVTKYLGILLEDSESADASADIIEENMQGILETAYEVILQQGYDYSVSGSIVYEYFPLRVYGDVALPPGYYTAFRIDIGEAAGTNWWCVLYPALCFADITHGVVPDESKEELRQLIGDEDYELTGTTTLEFKYLKFLNKWVE